MKYLVLSILLITSLFYLQANIPAPDSHLNENQNYRQSEQSTSTITDKLKIGTDTYIITIDSLGYDYKKSDYTYSFTLALNGTECSIDDSKSNMIIGCGYEMGKEIEITHITSETNQNMGWQIDGLGSICGNTYSKRTFLIFPFSNCSYELVEVDYKSDLAINRVGENTLELWYYEQHWGNTGTAGSFFAPIKKRITVDYNDPASFIYTKGKISDNLEFLVNAFEDFQPSYPGLIAAGVENLDIELINTAFEDYYDKEDESWYKMQKLPMTAEEIFDIVDYIKVNNKYPEKYKYLFS